MASPNIIRLTMTTTTTHNVGRSVCQAVSAVQWEKEFSINNNCAACGAGASDRSQSAAHRICTGSQFNTNSALRCSTCSPGANSTTFAIRRLFSPLCPFYKRAWRRATDEKKNCCVRQQPTSEETRYTPTRCRQDQARSRNASTIARRRTSTTAVRYWQQVMRSKNRAAMLSAFCRPEQRQRVTTDKQSGLQATQSLPTQYLTHLLSGFHSLRHLFV